MLRLRFLFGEMNPPALAQSSAACGVARYLISALPAWLLVNSNAASPPTMVEFGAGGSQVDVIEPVGAVTARAWPSADEEVSRARSLNGRGKLLPLVPGAPRVLLRLLEFLRAVPTCRFGRRYKPDSVQSVLE